MIEPIFIGSVVRIPVEVYTATVKPHVLGDPGTLTITVKPPIADATVFTYPADITRDSLGKFHVDFTVLEEGKHQIRIVTTGANPGADQTYFKVETPNI